MWIAVRASLRGVVENVTLADLAAGELPREVDAPRGATPRRWLRR